MVISNNVEIYMHHDSAQIMWKLFILVVFVKLTNWKVSVVRMVVQS